MINKKINNSIHFQRLPGGDDAIIFLHGWANSGENLRALAGELPEFDRYLIDLPGFGQSPEPDAPMTVPEYAAAIIDLAARARLRPWIIGHSFGGKIAMEIAAKYPESVRGIIVIAGGGIITRRARLRRIFFKPLARAARIFGVRGDKFRARLQSPDYRNSSTVMRGTMALNLKHRTLDIAKTVQKPALLIYGRRDTETPPRGGRKFARAIRHAKLEILDGFGHNDILTTGRFQLASLIKRFIK